jgi:hypothetical protein
VSGNGASNNGMRFPRRLSARDQELLLTGSPMADGGELDEVAAFVRALPAYVPEQPNEVLAAALVPRLAEAARTAPPREASPRETSGPAQRPWSRRALAARVAVAVALLPAFTAALAFAGVEVPRPAQDAFESVGVDLPNQDEADGTSRSGESAEPDSPDAPTSAPADQPSGGGGKPKAKEKSKSKGKAKAKGKPVQPGPSGEPVGQGKQPPGQTRPPQGNAHGQGKAKPNQGGGGGGAKGNGKSQGQEGGPGKLKKTPPGQVKQEAKPPPPGQAKKQE